MNSRALYLLLISVGFHTLSHAQLYKCKDALGSYSFQGTPCAAGSTDTQPKPQPQSTGGGMVEPSRSSKSGANWDTGPRQAAPSPPTVIIVRPPESTVTPAPVVQERVRRQTEQERQQAEQIRIDQEKMLAFNRSQRCHSARQQLNVVKTERPIFSYDNKGERQYVKDEDRKGVIAAAERQVAVECN